MWSLLFPLFLVACAYAYFRRRLDDLPALGVGVGAGVLAYTWLALAGYWLFSITAGFWLANSASVLVLLWFAYKKQLRAPDVRKIVHEHKLFSVLLLFAALLFSNIFFTHFLETEPDGLYSGGAVWGDLAFHLTVINYFLHGVSFPPVYTVFQSVMGYPFASSLFTAVLANGASIQAALIVPSVFLLLSFLALTYVAGLKLGFSKEAAVMGILILALSGGLGFMDFFKAASSHGIYEALAEKDYTILEPTGWANTMTSLLLPQRPFLFGAAVFAAVFVLLLSANTRRDYAVAGVVAGLMPFVHWHSYLVIQGVALVYAFLYREKRFAYYFLPSIVLAVPQVLWSLQQVSPTSFLHLQPNWVANTLDLFKAGAFWFTQSGFWIPAAIAGVWFSASTEQRKRFAPFAALFLLAALLVFQPWAYDNLKFFFYVQWMAAFLIAALVLRIASSKSAVFKAVALLLFVSLTLSGALAVTRETGLHWRLYDAQDLQLADWAEQNTAKDAVFLTSTQHNHPISSLAGRHVVLGYPGWLWSHGFDYSQTQADARRMFSGDKQLLAQYNVSYAVINAQARTEYSIDEPFFRNYELVFENPSYSVYIVSDTKNYTK